MDHERESGLMADPAAVLEHEVVRLRNALALVEAKCKALEAELAKRRESHVRLRAVGDA